jgi:hypothetical protein
LAPRELELWTIKYITPNLCIWSAFSQLFVANMNTWNANIRVSDRSKPRSDNWRRLVCKYKIRSRINLQKLIVAGLTEKLLVLYRIQD